MSNDESQQGATMEGFADQAQRFSQAQKRFGFTVSRPVAVMVIFLTGLVFGTFSLLRLPVNLMPALNYPKITVRAEYPGAAPAEVENDVARPLEEVMGVIAGVTKISSIARPNGADIVMEFGWATNMKDATTDVLEKLDMARGALPDQVKTPTILRYDPNLDPILVLSLSGDAPAYEGEAGAVALRKVGEREVKRLLEPLAGVASVKIRGGLSEEMHVDLDEDALRRTGIGIGDVISRLSASNVNIAGGTMREGKTRYLVRTVNEFQDEDEIAALVVASRDGKDIRLGDIARVERSHAQRDVVTRVSGRESVQVEIFKEADANIVETARIVKLAVEGGVGKLVKDELYAELKVVNDRSIFIRSSIDEVRSTALTGGALAILVLMLFLRRFSTTIVVGVAIPLSVLMTFAPMMWAGMTLNIMSLGGLALTIGMLVDNSIVVVESVHRCMEEGDPLLRATIRGVSEVGMAVVASTLTTIAVFFPMVFVEGVAGQLFSDLGLTVVFGLSASLAVALAFVPMLLSRKLDTRGDIKRTRRDEWRERWAKWQSVHDLLVAYRGPMRAILKVVVTPYLLVRFVVHAVVDLVVKLLGSISSIVGDILLAGFWLVSKVTALVARPILASFDAALRAVSWVYRKVLGFCLARPFATVMVIGALSYLAISQSPELDTELVPELHQGELVLKLALPVGTPLSETENTVIPLESELIAQIPHLKSLVTTIGTERDSSDEEEQGEHVAKMTVMLDSAGALASGDVASIADLEESTISLINAKLSHMPGVSASVRRPALFSLKPAIEVEVECHDLDKLRLAARKVADTMRSIDGLRDVESSVRTGTPEVQIIYHRDRLARLGLDVRKVAELVRDKVQGREATKIADIERKIPLRVRLAGAESARIEELRNLVVNPGTDHPIPLWSVAEVIDGESPNEIRRVSQRRIARVTASLSGAGLGSTAQELQSQLEQLDLGPDVHLNFAGQAQEWDASSGSLYLALGLSIFLVYVIMAAQFESLIDPLIILVTVPLASVGVLLGLNAAGLPVSILVGLGVITLVGVVVNNAIVLVDYANQLRLRGMTPLVAIANAGEARMRPILMTTMTTVLGLLPMALGLGDGAEMRQPMAVTIIAGLSSSTILTLIVVPTIYAIVNRRAVGTPADAQLILSREETDRATHNALVREETQSV